MVNYMKRFYDGVQGKKFYDTLKKKKKKLYKFYLL